VTVQGLDILHGRSGDVITRTTSAATKTASDSPPDAHSKKSRTHVASTPYNLEFHAHVRAA
jgi:hypothetical protein